MDYRLNLEENLKLKEIKPIIGITSGKTIYLIFFEEFSRNYQLLEKDNNNFNALISSGLFLHLTLEGYIVLVIEWLLKNINRRENRRLLKIWHNHFENYVNLNKKFQFFVEVFLQDDDIPGVKKIKLFINEISELRNKIVHGHEFSTTSWNDGKIEKTRLAELLTHQRIKKYYKNLIDCMDIMSKLIERIDIEDLTSGLLKERVGEYLKFI